MKKLLFFIATIFLFASCTQLGKDNGKTVGVSVKGRQVLPSNGVDYCDDNIYDFYLISYYAEESANEASDIEDKKNLYFYLAAYEDESLEDETQKPEGWAVITDSGKVSELAERTYTLGEFEIDRKMQISCYIAKKFIDSNNYETSDFLWHGETEPILIQKGVTKIPVKMGEEDKTNESPLIVYKNFMPKTAFFSYNYYEGKHQLSRQFRFIFPDNQHPIIAGEKYTLTFSTKVQNFKSYYFNFCDKGFLEGQDYSECALSPKGAYGPLEVKDGRISFTKTLLIEKSHLSPEDLVLDLTFILDKEALLDEEKNKTDEELQQSSFQMALDDISASIVKSNVVIEEKTDSTALTLNQRATPNFRNWFYNNGIENNELSYTIEFLDSSNERILQPLDVLTIKLEGTIEAAITKSSTMQNFFYANILPKDFSDWNNDILSTYGASEDGNNAEITVTPNTDTTTVSITATINIDKFANSNLPEDALLYLFFNVQEDPPENFSPTSGQPAFNVTSYSITSPNENLTIN